MHKHPIDCTENDEQKTYVQKFNSISNSEVHTENWRKY